ncbi:hypothetical protein ENBRE01_1186 [Enteropsectra breve]|nr:hypothetical protein ENBRE01_1186 [Enteropsectra breve]
MTKTPLKLFAIALVLGMIILYMSIKKKDTSKPEKDTRAPPSQRSNSAVPNYVTEFYERAASTATSCYDLENWNTNEERKQAIIKSQKTVMKQSCAHCKKPMNIKLFPASITLEKLMGAAEYPYESDFVSSFNLHVRVCRAKCLARHQHCSSVLQDKFSINGYLPECDTSNCVRCRGAFFNKNIVRTAVQCLYNSTKSYEFAYIYKTLQKYHGGDIRTSLMQTALPKEYAQHIKTNVEKCEFKGKQSILASLDYTMQHSSDDKVAEVLSRFLKYSLRDSIIDNSKFWDNYFKKMNKSEKRQCLMSAVDFISEEFVRMKADLYGILMFLCPIYLDTEELLKLIRKCLLSEQYFLLSFLLVAPNISYFQTQRHLLFANNLPGVFSILRIVETSLKNPAESILLKGCIDKKAQAVARCISAKPHEHVRFGFTAIFIYLKRLYKLKSKGENACRDKKKCIEFYESLIRHILEDFPKLDSPFLWPMVNESMFLKICIFYRKKYRYMMQQSPFLDLIFEKQDKNVNIYTSFSSEKKYLELNEEERKEVCVLRALSYCTGVRRTIEMHSIAYETQKLLADTAIKNGRSLMREGLELVPQICKKYYKGTAYTNFLHDLCYSTQFIHCVLDDAVFRDLFKACQKYSRAETGFLPLKPRFSGALNCEKWNENDVLLWCKKTNFIEWLRCLSDSKAQYWFVKRHLETILKYVLDNAGSDIRMEAELVVKCWLIASNANDKGCNVDIFGTLAAAKNGYVHANLYFLMNRKSFGPEMAMRLLDKICSSHNKDRSGKNGVAELQEKYIKFMKAWEETDIIFSCITNELVVKIRIFMDKLEEIRESRLQKLFEDFMKNPSALNSIKKNHKDFYKAMAESLISFLRRQ